MDLKKIKIELPKTWKETSRLGGENQVVIHVYHKNPLAGKKPKDFQDQPIETGDSTVSKHKIGIISPSGAGTPISNFYEGMKAAIQSGLMSAEWTTAKLDNLWKGMTASPHAERPGESDMTDDIEIIRCENEEVALQTVKNKALMPTQGFDVPIPGFQPPPGVSKNMTMSGLLQSDFLKDFLKNHVPKERLGDIEKMQSAIKEFQTKMPGVKQGFEKRGIKIKEGKLFGCQAFYFASPNPSPPPKSGSARKTSLGEVNGGGACVFPEGMNKLPKVEKPYSAINKMCIGMAYKNFIISGGLLTAWETLPPGNTPCYSLTQTKEVVSKMKEGGQTFTDIAIVPLPSTYAREGYLHKEEVEEIYRDIISKLK